MSTVLDAPSATGHPAPIPPATFAARRERFLDALGEGVAILPAHRVLLKSRDTDVRFRQDSDLLYLTAFPEPDAVAVFAPHDPAHRFTLFVNPRNPEREAWDGPRAGVEGARDRYGADAAYPLEELEERLKGLVEPADALWMALGRYDDLDRAAVSALAGFRRTRAKSGKGPYDVRDPAQLLDPMRRIKEPAELDWIRAAARVAADGHLAALAATRDGVGEWELEAVLDHVFRRAGGWGAAYPSIVGSGPNATILHHTTNDRVARAGELVLVDAGAELGGYCADITRTWPVSGAFDGAQRAVYEIVRAALDAAIDAARPGHTFDAVHDAARRVLVRGMVDLGLLEGDVDGLIESEAFRRFFLHGTSHWLGLDVHDSGVYRQRDGEWVTLEPGMVMTVEPGLYVPAGADDVPEALRGIGVRLEDDVIITAGGPEVITRGVPVDPDEIAARVGAPR